jgi:hypothetical protein
MNEVRVPYDVILKSSQAQVTTRSRASFVLHALEPSSKKSGTRYTVYQYSVNDCSTLGERQLNVSFTGPPQSIATTPHQQGHRGVAVC